MSQTNKPIGFYLHTPEDNDKIMTNSNPTQQYLIHCNDRLNQEIRVCEKQVREKQEELQELEKERDALETSNQYMKKLLVNFLELKKMAVDIKDKHCELKRDTEKKYQKILHHQNQFLQSYVAMMVIIWAFFRTVEFVFGYEVTFVLNFLQENFQSILLFTCTAYLWDKCMFFSLVLECAGDISGEEKQKLQKIRKLEDEMKKVEDGHDYINEYITCL